MEWGLVTVLEEGATGRWSEGLRVGRPGMMKRVLQSKDHGLRK